MKGTRGGGGLSWVFARYDQSTTSWDTTKKEVENFSLKKVKIFWLRQQKTWFFVLDFSGLTEDQSAQTEMVRVLWNVDFKHFCLFSNNFYFFFGKIRPIFAIVRYFLARLVHFVSFFAHLLLFSTYFSPIVHLLSNCWQCGRSWLVVAWHAF